MNLIWEVITPLSDKIFNTKTKILNDKYSQFKRSIILTSLKTFHFQDKFSYISANFDKEYKTIVLGSYEKYSKTNAKGYSK